MSTRRSLRLLALLAVFAVLLGCACSALAGKDECKKGNHQWGKWEEYSVDIDLTCGDTAARYRTCKVCGETEGERYKLTHIWGDWKIEYPPHDGKPGLLKRVCKRCGEVEYKYYNEEEPEYGLALNLELLSPYKEVYDIGDELIFGLTLINTGKTDMTMPWVVLENSLGNQFGFVIDETGTLPAKASMFSPDEGYTFTYTVSPTDGANGFFGVVGHGGALKQDMDDMNADDVKMEFTAQFSTKLNLTVQNLTPKSYYKANDVISFALIVQNASDVSLFDPEVSMEAPDGSSMTDDRTCVIAMLHTVIFGGGTGKSFNYTVRPEDEGGSITFKFNARAYVVEWDDPAEGMAYADTVELTYPTTEQYAAISLKVSGDDSKTLKEGDKIPLTVTVTNEGTKPISSIVLYHTNAKYDTFDPNQFSVVLIPGGTVTGTYYLTVDSSDAAAEEAIRDFSARGSYPTGGGLESYVWSNDATFSVPVEGPEHGVPVLSVTPHFRGRDYNYGGDPVDFNWNVSNKSQDDYYLIKVYCSKDGGPDMEVMSDGGTDPAHLLKSFTGHIGDQWTQNLPETNGSNITVEYKFSADVTEAVSGKTVRIYCAPIPVQVLGSIPPWVPEHDVSVAVTKKAISQSKDPKGYISGETVSYKITVENTCEETLCEIEVTDPLKGENEDAVVGIIAKLAPGESADLYYDYIVTDWDCVVGEIRNTATASWYDEYTDQRVEFNSLEEIVYTVAGVEPTVYKYDSGMPGTYDDGTYYIPGDVISFVIVVENKTGITFTNVKVYEPLDPNGIIAEFETLAPFESHTIHFEYLVTEDDCIYSYLNNQVTLLYEISEDATFLESNEVRVPVGIPKEVTVVKTETSKPSNAAELPLDKAYYQEGEIITYDITIKNGFDYPIYDLELYDILQDYPGPYVTYPSLNPGEVLVYPFSYQVTKDDVEIYKQVVNYAWLNFKLKDTRGNNKDLQKVSNVVISPCDLLPPPPPPFEPDTGIDWCERTLVSDENGLIVYRLHHCGEHKDVQEALDKALEIAVNDEERLAAYAEARTGWTVCINDLYDKYINATTVTGQYLVMQEKAAFFNYVTLLDTELNALYPDDPLRVAKEINTVLENRCADLCLEYNRAGMPRKDCPDRLMTGGETAEHGEKCEITVMPIENTDVTTVINCCVTHAGLTVSSRGEWLKQLNASVSERYRTAGEDIRPLIRDSRNALGTWLDARKDLLNIIYPSGGTTDEVIRQTMRFFAVTDCSR